MARWGLHSIRRKLVVACIFLVAAPLVAAWAMGAYDAVIRYRVRSELREVGERLVREASEFRDTSARGDWLERFGRENGVYIRILDGGGVVVASSAPSHGEGRFSSPTMLSRVGDFFFGPSGPPDLAAHEQSRPALADRPEVQTALSGRADEAWVAPASTKFFAFYRAVPIPNVGVAHITRLSRRTVRGLYDLRYQLLKLSLGLFVVALVFGFWLSRRIAKPIEEIQRSVRAHLETGAPVPIALDREDELGALSRDFDELASRLSKQTAHTARVSADLAHDLKSPLSTVATSAELLESLPELDDAKRARIATALARAAQHMERSVDALLMLARLDERLVNEARERAPLSPILQRIIDAYRSDPTTAEIELTLKLPEAEIIAFVAEPRVEQALRNMIDNALVFARAHVRVTLAARGSDFVIQVADDGAGVSAGNRDKVFTRFFSARPHGGDAGTGLGLPICQAIASTHGGTVELDAESPLGGAAFSFVAPRVGEPTAKQAIANDERL